MIKFWTHRFTWMTYFVMKHAANPPLSCLWECPSLHYEPVSSDPMLTLRKRWGSLGDGTARKDILFPAKEALGTVGAALFWLMTGWELQCSRLEWADGWNREAEGWRGVMVNLETGWGDALGGGGSRDITWVLPVVLSTWTFSFSWPSSSLFSSLNWMSNSGILLLFSSLKLHTVLWVSCPSPNGREPPLPRLQLSSSSSSSLVHWSMLGEWRSLCSCADVRRRAPPMSSLGDGAALRRRLKRAKLGWRLPDSSRFSAMSSRGWKCISSLGILSRNTCCMDLCFAGGGQRTIPATHTHAMSNVDPWKEGLRKSKRVAAVYGGLGLESFQYRSRSIIGRSPYISSTAIIDTCRQTHWSASRW